MWGVYSSYNVANAKAVLHWRRPRLPCGSLTYAAGIEASLRLRCAMAAATLQFAAPALARDRARRRMIFRNSFIY